jgi:hypothetical protein
MTLLVNEGVSANRDLHYLERIIEDFDRVTNASEFNGVFTLAHIHGMPYSGPVFDLELIGDVRRFLREHSDYLNLPLMPMARVFRIATVILIIFIIVYSTRR